MAILDGAYWNERYLHHNTGWDIGYPSTPIKAYIDQLKDKSISILIPGCGNGYEAIYLLEQGFQNITLIDIAPILTESLQKKLPPEKFPQLKIITGDFFTLVGQFDLILEQTFFCALDPSMRQSYANKMIELLIPGGKLAGVLFNREFEGGPPFGGKIEEYRLLFGKKFNIRVLEQCYNSISPRTDQEVFILLQKFDTSIT